MFSDGLSAGAAGQVYTRLTVGDGLVSQLPALIMAICAGAIITRVTTERQNDLGTDIAEKQKLADATQLEIDAARQAYKPCGEATAVLFFCIADLKKKLIF